MSREESRLTRRRMANAYLSSIISISLVLVLIGLATLLVVNAGSVSDYFKENMQVSVLLRPEAEDGAAEDYAAFASRLPYVKGTRTVSREEGTRELAEMLGDDFLSVFETSPVPVSVDVTLHPEYVCPDSLDFVLPALSSHSAVDEVNCQQSLVEALNSNLAKISLALGVLILLLLFISFVLINNTVRLSVFSRRFTVHTMKLVGATKSYIRRPFLLSSVWQGLLASAVAAGVLAGLMFALRRSFPQLFSIIRPGMLAVSAAVVFACGVLLCVSCTFFVVGKLVSLDKNDLYY